MIRADQIVQIGNFYKTHGIKGELSAGFDYDFEPDILRCIILEVDGIYVPFFIESWRLRGPGRYLIKLEGVDDETEASALVNHTIYAIADELPPDESDYEDGVYLYDLIGYELVDGDATVGTISDVDDTTENILFHVKSADGRTIFVPFAEEWIEEIDGDKKLIKMILPEGILDLNS